MKVRAKANLLKFYLRRTPPLTHISAYAIDGQPVDAIYVYVRLTMPEAPETQAIAESVNSNHVKCVYWNSKNEPEYLNIPLGEFFTLPITVRYFRPWFHLVYDNLYEPVIDIFGGIHYRELKRGIFESRLKNYENLTGILRHAVEMHKARFRDEEPSLTEVITGQKVLTIHSLLIKIHGDKIVNSSRYREYFESMQFHIAALIASEDLLMPSENSPRDRFAVAPKALNTLAAHELEMKKFRDSLRPTRWLAFLTALYVLATGVQVFLLWQSASAALT